MEKEEIAPHVEDVAKALGNKVSSKEIEEELNNFLKVYKVPMDVAKRSIVRKHNGDLSALSLGTQKTLGELTGSETNVDLLARVLSINPKEVEVEGKKKNLFYGILGDQTMTIPFTAWDTDFGMQKGDVVRIRNAYTKEWQGKKSVNLGSRASVKKEDADALPRTRAVDRSQHCSVKDFREGLGNIAATVRILSVERREVTVDGEKKFVYSGMIGDSTGKSQFSAWHDFKLRDGEIFSIKGAYVTSWRGIPQLNFDEGSKVEKVKDEKFPSAKELLEKGLLSIEEIAERQGTVDGIVRGVVIDLKSGSGLIFRCPQCKRVVVKGTCKLHGAVDGSPDLRVKAVVDDGTGAMTAVFNRDITEQILESNMDEALKLAKDAMNADVVRDRLFDKLVAKPVQVRGNVTIDEFGLMMIASNAEFLGFDAKEEARKMLDGLDSDTESDGGGE